MKAISLPVATRPHYLKQMLSTLKECNLNGYTLYVNAEPNQDVIDVVNDITFIETKLVVNKERLGVRRNPFNVLDRAFQDADFVVHLEDDLIVSPDALDLANWYYDTFKDDPTKYMAYGFFNYESDMDEPEEIIQHARFNGLGWCTFKTNWNKWFRPIWFDDDINKRVWGPNTWGWDWSVQAVCKTEGLNTLIPSFGRSNHIGREGGTYCGAQFHDQTFTSLIINQDPVEDLDEYFINYDKRLNIND